MKFTHKKSIQIECNICGKILDDGSRGLNGKWLCPTCIDQIALLSFCQNMNESQTDNEATTDTTSEQKELHNNEFSVVNPIIIKQKLDEYVIGQDSAKKTLAVAATNHYKRIIINKNEEKVEKSNLLLIGPTGSGKTYLIRSLAKILDVPFVIADAANLTESGYKGADVDGILSSLLINAGGNISRAEHGIVFIDEIDKLAKGSVTDELVRAIGKDGVQQALLKLLEGGTVCVDGKEINTKEVLFICGGAFPHLKDIILNRNPKINDSTNILHYVTDADIEQFGLIPEFISRLPIITILDEMTIDMLKDIMTKPKKNLISQYQELLHLDGLDISFNESAINEIARIVCNKNRGARGLRYEMDRMLEPVMFSAPKYPQGTTFQITYDTTINHWEMITNNKSTNEKPYSKYQAI